MSVIAGVICFVAGLGCGGFLEHRACKADIVALEAQLITRATNVRNAITKELDAVEAIPAEIKAKFLAIVKRGA